MALHRRRSMGIDHVRSRTLASSSSAAASEEDADITARFNVAAPITRQLHRRPALNAGVESRSARPSGEGDLAPAHQREGTRRHGDEQPDRLDVRRDGGRATVLHGRRLAHSTRRRADQPACRRSSPSTPTPPHHPRVRDAQGRTALVAWPHIRAPMNARIESTAAVSEKVLAPTRSALAERRAQRELRPSRSSAARPPPPAAGSRGSRSRRWPPPSFAVHSSAVVHSWKP